MRKIMPLTGLVAAVHTPFHADGTLNVAVVEKQASHLLQHGVQTVFVAGSTGESHSLTLDERLALAKRWSEVARGATLQVVVHVGSNCLADARVLAAQAQSLGVTAIAAVAPSYFKPKMVETLVACCQEIASAAPALPFYFYDIPVMTNVNLPMPDFLDLASERIPTLAGLKFTNPDLMAYQRCLRLQAGRFDVPWGLDEILLAALAVGAVGAVGSTYNFAAPIYHRVMAAFTKGDFAAARAEQFRSVQMIDLLIRHGFTAAAKTAMGLVGVEVGPSRLPNTPLTAEQVRSLRSDLERLGFFDWVRA